MKKHLHLGAALAGILTLALIGCAPTPVHTPTPTATFLCTPEAGGAEYPCNQADYDAMKARDADYAEAERVYREATRISYELASREQAYSPELDALVTGEYADSMRATLEQALTDAAIYEGQVEIVRVDRLVGVSDLGSTLALRVCSNPGTLRVRANASARPVTPSPVQADAFFTRIDGRWLVSSGTFESVESCER